MKKSVPHSLRKKSPRGNKAVPGAVVPHPLALDPVSTGPERAGPHWTFLTNHSHVLVMLARNPAIVLREVAIRVGITERAVQRIIADLEADGFLERQKVGRQNHYRILEDQPLRHPIEAHRSIGDLLHLLSETRG